MSISDSFSPSIVEIKFNFLYNFTSSECGKGGILWALCSPLQSGSTNIPKVVKFRGRPQSLLRRQKHSLLFHLL